MTPAHVGYEGDSQRNEGDRQENLAIETRSEATNVGIVPANAAGLNGKAIAVGRTRYRCGPFGPERPTHRFERAIVLDRVAVDRPGRIWRDITRGSGRPSAEADSASSFCGTDERRPYETTDRNDDWRVAGQRTGAHGTSSVLTAGRWSAGRRRAKVGRDDAISDRNSFIDGLGDAERHGEVLAEASVRAHTSSDGPRRVHPIAETACCTRPRMPKLCEA